MNAIDKALAQLKVMSREEALAQLKTTRELTTTMLEPLGISFESFLKLSQLTKEHAAVVIEKLIARLEREDRA